MKTKGIILLVILLMGVLVLIFGVKKEESPRTATIGLDAPGVWVRDEAGRTYTLSEMKGSVVFINFWASWCPPCKDEMPSIQGLYDRFKDEKRFRMVTVLYRDDYGKATSYLKENKFDFPVLTDVEGRTARSYGVTGVPESYIVDKRGILRDKVIGPAEWGSPEKASLISGLLAE